MIHRKRHIAKTITWRIIATTITVGFTWLVTRDWSIATSVGAFNVFTKSILYYLHERLWYRTKYGVQSALKDKGEV
jgi:uncharacterized membrane protein